MYFRGVFFSSFFMLASGEALAASLDPNFFGAQAFTSTQQNVLGAPTANSVTDEDMAQSTTSASTSSSGAGGEASASYDHTTGTGALSVTSDALGPFVDDPATPIFNRANASFYGIDILRFTGNGIDITDPVLFPSPELTVSLHIEGSYTLDSAQLRGTESHVFLQSSLISSGSNATPIWTASSESNCATSATACLSGGIISEVLTTTFTAERQGTVNSWESIIEPFLIVRAINGASLDLTATLKIDFTEGYSYTSKSGTLFTAANPAQVPVPASLPLLLMALGGLGALMRNRAFTS